MKSPKIVISAGLNQNIDNYINALEFFNTNIVIANAITKTKILEDKYDGLVLTGGGDISPELYECRIKFSDNTLCFGTSLERDKTEFELIKNAYEKNIPIFGICRGMQLLNVYFNGFLIQNVNQLHYEICINSDKKLIKKRVLGILMQENIWILNQIFIIYL